MPSLCLTLTITLTDARVAVPIHAVIVAFVSAGAAAAVIFWLADLQGPCAGPVAPMSLLPTKPVFPELLLHLRHEIFLLARTAWVRYQATAAAGRSSSSQNYALPLLRPATLASASLWPSSPLSFFVLAAAKWQCGRCARDNLMRAHENMCRLKRERQKGVPKKPAAKSTKKRKTQQKNSTANAWREPPPPSPHSPAQSSSSG